MKVITVNEPKFVAEFQCAGSQCIDHCCQGWNIIFDKKATNKYLKSPIIEIKNIATDAVQLLKKSHANWAEVKLNQDNVCGFMDESKLCKIHALMGASALSHTCATYPRLSHKFKNEENKTLQLSCPEATRALLLSDDAMQMITLEKVQSKSNANAAVNQYDKLINLMSMYLINASQAATEQGLYAIASLLLLAEKSPQQVETLENYFASLMASIEQGEMAEQINALGSNPELQYALLLRLQTYLDSQKKSRSLGRLKWYVARLLQVQISEVEDSNVVENMKNLDHAWSAIVKPWLNERPHIMRNYMMYRLYSDQFPHSQHRHPMSGLYLLTAEWFLIKSMIAASAKIDGEISEKVIIDIIYSFHAITKHSKRAEVAFLAQIEKVKINDDLSLLYLLK